METDQRTWVEKVHDADEEAERAQTMAFDLRVETDDGGRQALALLAIAAELRAARIAARPGGKPKP